MSIRTREPDVFFRNALVRFPVKSWKFSESDFKVEFHAEVSARGLLGASREKDGLLEVCYEDGVVTVIFVSQESIMAEPSMNEGMVDLVFYGIRTGREVSLSEEKYRAFIGALFPQWVLTDTQRKVLELAIEEKYRRPPNCNFEIQNWSFDTSKKAETSIKVECTCPIQDLMIRGCTCGAIKTLKHEL